MDDNHLSDPTECINVSHFSDQNYAYPNDLMNLHSTSMPSPVPAPNLNHIPTSIPFANQDTEIYPSNNNYANDDPLFHYFNDENELNVDDQAYIISTSEYHKNDYYVAHDPNPATSSDSLHPISQDERKIVDNISDELNKMNINH